VQHGPLIDNVTGTKAARIVDVGKEHGGTAEKGGTTTDRKEE
jgi:hypothetical protein